MALNRYAYPLAGKSCFLEQGWFALLGISPDRGTDSSLSLTVFNAGINMLDDIMQIFVVRCHYVHFCDLHNVSPRLEDRIRITQVTMANKP